MAGNSEFTIPLNVVTKIIAESLPDESTVTVEQDYIKALARAAHLFILYSSTRANEIANENNRRTIQSQDIISAISFYGFDHLIPRLISWHRNYLDEKQQLKKLRLSEKKLSNSEESNENINNNDDNNKPTAISVDEMEVEIITNDNEEYEQFD